MTTVYIDNDRIEITGHSGNHDVCCMVSTLINHFMYNASENYGIHFDMFVTEDAHSVIRDLDILRADRRGEVLLDSLIYSFKLLAEDFPDNVRISERALKTTGCTADYCYLAPAT